MRENLHDADTKSSVHQKNALHAHFFRKIQELPEAIKTVCILSALFVLLCASSYGMNSSAELQESMLDAQVASTRFTVAIPEDNPASVRSSVPSNAPAESDLSVDESTAPASPSYSLEEEDSRTVYISRSGKIHLRSSCSGMEYFTEMSYSEAVKQGYTECSKCFR